MAQTAQWFEDMAKAMKTREKCLNAIERWTEALKEAEEVITRLSLGVDVPPVADPVFQQADGQGF